MVSGFYACNTTTNTTTSTIHEIIETSEYSLYKSSLSKGTLIIFPCFPCDAQHSILELGIHKEAQELGYSTLYLNYNRKLYLSEEEKESLMDDIITYSKEHKLHKHPIYLGGFSSGGNIALITGNKIQQTKNPLDLKGIFIVDSPIDLEALYKTSERNIERQFSLASIQESTMLIQQFDNAFGHPNENREQYEANAPFTSSTSNIDNIQSLKNVPLRLYTEPDTAWWKENRKAEYEDMNAYYIEQLYNTLDVLGWSSVEIIKTSDKGYRANGTRHPHSWSIIDKENLLDWIKENN